MTRYEILHMEAGREMDALIAEKILGMTRAHSKDFDIFQNEEYYWRDWEVPHYSEDIEMAWEVVIKFHFFQITMNNPERWGAAGSFAGNLADYSAMANTAPLAICRAALLAKLEGL